MGNSYITNRLLDGEEVEVYTGPGVYKDDPRLLELIRYGMPASAERVLLKSPGINIEKHFKDFKFYYFGVRISKPPDDVFNVPLNSKQIIPDNSDMSPGAFVGYHRRDGSKAYMQVWLHRVVYKQPGAYIEELWHPQNGWLTHIEGIQRTPIKDRIRDVQLLATALLSLSDLGRERALRLQHINSAIMKMVTDQEKRGAQQPKPFRKSDFWKAYPLKYKSLSSFYQIIPDKTWPDIETAYLQLWEERNKQA